MNVVTVKTSRKRKTMLTEVADIFALASVFAGMVLTSIFFFLSVLI